MNNPSQSPAHREMWIEETYISSSCGNPHPFGTVPEETGPNNAPPSLPTHQKTKRPNPLLPAVPKLPISGSVISRAGSRPVFYLPVSVSDSNVAFAALGQYLESITKSGVLESHVKYDTTHQDGWSRQGRVESVHSVGNGILRHARQNTTSRTYPCNLRCFTTAVWDCKLEVTGHLPFGCGH